MSDTSTPTDRWRLDKGIPVALLLGLLGMTCSGAWFLSGDHSELENHERRLTSLEINVQKLADTLNGFGLEMHDVAGSVAAAKDQLKATSDRLQYTDDQLSRFLPPQKVAR